MVSVKVGVAMNRISRAEEDCSQRGSFFFSSRRRHTRLQGDWSSDVCSSDLYQPSHANADVNLYKPSTAYRFFGGGFGGGGGGRAAAVGQNPPSGAIIYYSLKTDRKSVV